MIMICASLATKSWPLTFCRGISSRGSVAADFMDSSYIPCELLLLSLCLFTKFTDNTTLLLEGTVKFCLLLDQLGKLTES